MYTLGWNAVYGNSAVCSFLAEQLMCRECGLFLNSGFVDIGSSFRDTFSHDTKWRVGSVQEKIVRVYSDRVMKSGLRL